jgi:hypothetical protein
MNESLKTVECPRQVDVVSDAFRVDDSSKIPSSGNSNSNNSNSNSNNNKRLLMLFSSTSDRPNQKTAQNRALTILKGMRIDDQSQYLEQLDGASTDPNHRERRNELFALSGCIREQYPQFFLVDCNDKIKFLCEWETFELMNDAGILSGFMNLGNTSYTTTMPSTSTMTTTASSSSSYTIQKQQDAVYYGGRRLTRTFLTNNSCPILIEKEVIDTTIRPLRTRVVDERTNQIDDGRKQEVTGHNYDDDAVELGIIKSIETEKQYDSELIVDVQITDELQFVGTTKDISEEDRTEDEEEEEIGNPDTVPNLDLSSEESTLFSTDKELSSSPPYNEAELQDAQEESSSAPLI